MDNDAIAAGPQVRDDTKRKGTTAGLLAALWPSLLGPEHGLLWREQNRRIWARRVSHVALIAALIGIGTIAHAPRYDREGEADILQDQTGARHAAHGGTAGATGHSDDGLGMERLSIALRTLQRRAGSSDFMSSADVQSTAGPETADDHGEDVGQGPESHGQHSFWALYGLTSPSFGSAAFGGGAGGGGSGGTASGGGGSSSGPSQGDEPTVTDASGPGMQPTPSGPQTPDEPRAPYTVDPDDGPHEPCDPRCSPPKDWPPQTGPSSPALSPVPEPQTWLMMIVGFGCLGCALRSRPNNDAFRA